VLNDNTRPYNKFFEETYSLFKEVTSYALLLENIGGGKVEVTSINELRSVLYHLYAFLDNPKQDQGSHLELNYIEAKEHLYRAYYDLFTMLFSFISDNIYSYSKLYELSVINTFYPKYFTNITPELTIISEKVAHLRSDRQTNKKMPEEGIISNNGIVTILLQWYKELQSMTSAFIEAQEKINADKRSAKKKDRFDLILKISIPIIALVLGFLLNYFFIKN
jgi:hypothetical protein